MDTSHAKAPSVLETDNQPNTSAFIQIGPKEEARPDRLDLQLMGLKTLLLETCILAVKEETQNLEKRVEGLEAEVQRLSSLIATPIPVAPPMEIAPQIQPLVLPGIIPVEIPAQEVPTPAPPTPEPPPLESVEVPAPEPPAAKPKRKTRVKKTNTTEVSPEAPTPIKKHRGRKANDDSEIELAWRRARKLRNQINNLRRKKRESELPHLNKEKFMRQYPPRQEEAQETTAASTASEDG